MGRSDQPRDQRGRFTSTGTVVIGVAIALGVSGIGGVTGIGGTTTSSIGTSNVSTARVTQSKQAARSGRADDAWRGLKLRRVRKAAERAANCAVNSYGQVREFFLRNPCKSLDRTLFTLADPAGDTFVVSVSWVRMHRGNSVRRLKGLIDEDGTGSVTQLGAQLLREQGVRFTGTPFRSRTERNLLVVAEGAAVSGQPDPEFFAMVVDIAAQLPR
jgi:hypothetical protein